MHTHTHTHIHTWHHTKLTKNSKHTCAKRLPRHKFLHYILFLKSKMRFLMIQYQGKVRQEHRMCCGTLDEWTCTEETPLPWQLFSSYFTWNLTFCQNRPFLFQSNFPAFHRQKSKGWQRLTYFCFESFPAGFGIFCVLLLFRCPPFWLPLQVILYVLYFLGTVFLEHREEVCHVKNNTK